MSTASSPQETPVSTNNADLLKRKENAIARGQGQAAPIFIERAENAEMWDADGNRYIDFGAGIAVCNTGHLHPKVKAAVAEQLEKVSHTCITVTPYAVAVELAEKLNALAPGDSAKKTMFISTGAEAVENSIKIARARTGRRGVIAFNGAFHGRTLLAMGLTGKVTPYKKTFGPFPGDIYHVPFPIEYHGITVEHSLQALEQLFLVDIDPTDVAAIIIEPVQGEGGFYAAPDEFLHKIREICDQHDIVMIADEIQSGFARTGKFFSCEYSGVEPDLITIAKGLAGGFPLAAVTGKADIMDAPHVGGLGSTYAGSPIGCAAALAVIDVIEEENLTEAALHIAKTFYARLQVMKSKYPGKIGEIRCDRGAMMAIELVNKYDADQPDADLAKALARRVYDHGLVLLSCGSRGNVIRFLPPLTISDELIHEGLDIIEQCLSELLH